MGLRTGTARVLAMTDYRHTPAVHATLEPHWRVQPVGRTEEVLWRLRSADVCALILSLQLAKGAAEEALEAALHARPDLPIVVVIEPGGEDRAAWALSRGAAGYVLSNTLPRMLRPVLESVLLARHTRQLQAEVLSLEHRERVRDLVQKLRHEINNPLTGIIGTAEIALKAADLQPAVRRRLASILELAQQIRGCVKELEALPEFQPR